MKKILFLFNVVLVLLFVSCVGERASGTNDMELLSLTHIDETYTVEDYTDLGFWFLDLRTSSLQSERYRLMIDEQGCELTINPLMDDCYLALIPESFGRETIEKAIITGWGTTERVGERAVDDLFVEYVYIRKSEVQNGTDLYKLLLTDYVALKQASDPFIYEGGKLIRPEYVVSSDGYTYTMKFYYDARQVSPTHTVDGAFTFLKTLPNHGDYVFEGEPNIVSINEGQTVVQAPDDRDRIRDLGSMGDMSGANAYNIVKDDPNSFFRVTVKQSEIPEVYRGSDSYSMEIKQATECGFSQTETPGIFEATVSYAITTQEDVIKNARFFIGSPFAGGSGSQDAPYQIANWKQLSAIAESTETLTLYYVLTTHLSSETAFYDEYASPEANDGKGWEPIGDCLDYDFDRNFTGSFNGKYNDVRYTISDLTINRPDTEYVGLFGYTTDAEFINCSLTEASVTGKNYVGVLAGRCIHSTVIENYTTGQASGTDYIGGLLGFADAATVQRNYSNTHVYARNSAGGLIGNTRNMSVVENCYATGDVTGTGSVGGLIGSDAGSFTWYMNKCYATGRVTGTTSTGGLGGSGVYSYHSFWDRETTLQETSTTGDGKTTEEMKTKTTFTDEGWAFDGEYAIWGIEEGPQKSYPYLLSIPQEPKPGLE